MKWAWLLALIATSCAGLQTVADNLTRPETLEPLGEVSREITRGTPYAGYGAMVAAALSLIANGLTRNRLKKKNSEQWKAQSEKDARLRELEVETKVARATAELRGKPTAAQGSNGT